MSRQPAESGRLTKGSIVGLAGYPMMEREGSRMGERAITTAAWRSFLDQWNRDLLDDFDPTEIVYSSLYRENGFLYASTICSRLKAGQDPLANYLLGQFSSATRQLIEQYTPPDPIDSELTKPWVVDASGHCAPPNKPDPPLLRALVDELNRLLQGPLLYEEERFKGIQLSEKAESFIAQEPSGERLIRLNRMLMDAAFPHSTGRNHNHYVETDLGQEVIASGWLGYEGATEDQIAGLEGRLGRSLPPSYRAFLTVSNGFRMPGGQIERLLSTDEVDWFRVRNPGLVEAWTVDDLTDTLAVSMQDIDHNVAYLLDPNTVSADGEWVALYLDCWSHCASYPSFWELMQAMRR
jgi:hypothetical protein